MYSALPLGYEDQDGKLVPVDEGLIVVSEIKEMREGGLSFHKISDDLNGAVLSGSAAVNTMPALFGRSATMIFTRRDRGGRNEKINR